MTNRIETIFAEQAAAGRKSLAPFICGGHPSLEDTTRCVASFGDAGASLMEVGIPFSDPIADGPLIAEAMHAAIERGVTPRSVLEAIADARSKTTIGIVAMVSVSIVSRLGVDRAARLFREHGVDGVILPDVPIEEAPSVIAPFREEGLTATLLVAPTTPPERAERIVAACSGFVYVVTRVGLTGEGDDTALANPQHLRDLGERIASLRTMTDLPIACGFGIVSPAHVTQTVREGGADAAIVGSALVRRMSEAHASGVDPAAEGAELVRRLAKGLSG